MKKILLLVFVSLLLFSILGVMHLTAQVEAEPKMIYVDSSSVDDPLEDGSLHHPFDKIQEGIDVAVPGDTVFAYGGTYYEWNVLLDKDNLSLVGENKDNTVIDGMNCGWILIITAKNVTVTGFTIQKSSIGTAGIFLKQAKESKIRNNIIKNHDSGVYSVLSNCNIIENNWVSDNYAGIILSSYCGENRISNNVVVGNTRGIDLSNHAHHNEIRNNRILQNTYGFSISHDNNSISSNQIINNHVGIYEDLLTGPARGYRIYHNNFINNTKQIDLRNQSVNIWDNGLEGNYWSDYDGTDSDQDGIGDISKVINANNTDHFPLMGFFSDFPVPWKEKIYHATTISNFSISAFEFEQLNSMIRFNVTSEEGIGFCRVCIPHDLIGHPYTVSVGGYPPQYVNYTLHDNGTHRWIYFTYPHSTREVTIIPESSTSAPPSLLLVVLTVLLLLVVLTVAIAIYKRRLKNTNCASDARKHQASANSK